MDLTAYTDSLRDDLTAAAALGDEQTRRTAAALATAVEPALRLSLMSALSDLAAEITAALGDRVVEVRLDGRDVRVVVTGDVVEAEPAPGPRSVEDVTGDISRVTLRVVEQVKAKAEEAASQQGMSLNSWLSQAVQGALREPGARPRPDTDGGTGSLRGWVQG